MTDISKLSTCYIALDVEKKGAGFQYPVIEVGIAWGTNNTNVQKLSICLDYKDAPFEERCYREFWVHCQDNLKRIEAAAVQPLVGWQALVDLMHRLEQVHSRITLVSDNPAYDIEAVDWHLYQEFGRLGVRYDSQGRYRSICDPSEQGSCLPSSLQQQIAARLAERGIKHTHQAADDAECMLQHQLLLDRVREGINKRLAPIDLDTLLSVPC